MSNYIRVKQLNNQELSGFVGTLLVDSGVFTRIIEDLTSGFYVDLKNNQLISGIKTFASRPTVNGSGVLLSNEAGFENKILNTTYSTLTGLKGTNNLTSGQLYRISDFVLKWNNQSNNDQTVKTAVSGEPLIVTALSNKKISHIAQSETYPQDTIYYNIDASGSYSWGTINNNASIPNFKGWIYRRVDNLLDIDIHYDWRNITVNCCKPDVSSVPNYSGNYQYSKLDYVKETGNNSNRGKLYYSVVTGNSGNLLSNTSFWNPVSDFVESGTFFSTNESYGFRALYDGVNIGNFIIDLPAITGSRIQQPTFTSALTGLGVFTLNNVKSIKIGDSCNNVIIGNDFYSNTIGDNFNFNTISNNFHSNAIGPDFYSNTIGNNFYSNAIGNNFHSNAIGNDFYSNTIGNVFYSNSINSEFYYNTIGNNFFYNISEDNFNNVNFLTSTHVYNSYNTTLFRNAAGTQRLRYFNSSDQLVVTDPTA
jgi:hypothetical protein